MEYYFSILYFFCKYLNVNGVREEIQEMIFFRNHLVNSQELTL